MARVKSNLAWGISGPLLNYYPGTTTVTILANEVSKETKVSNGALVGRNGQTVKTQNQATMATFADAVKTQSVAAGDIMQLSNEAGRVSATVEAISYLDEGEAVVKAAGATLIYQGADADVLYFPDNADNDMSPLRILAKSEDESRKLNSYTWEDAEGDVAKYGFKLGRGGTMHAMAMDVLCTNHFFSAQSTMDAANAKLSATPILF